MKQKFLDRIQTVSNKKQLIAWLLIGFLIGLLLYSVCLFLTDVNVLYYMSWIAFLVFYPILTFFVTYYLDLDICPTILVYIGASLAYVAFNLSFDNLFRYRTLIVVFSSALGILSYRGREDGWVGWILRVLSLSPPIVITLFPSTVISLITWDLYTFFLELIILMLAVIIHYLIRRKLVFRLRNLIFLTIYTFLAGTMFFKLLSFVVFLIFNPGYYP